MLDHQLAWWVAGPVLGLCVVACRTLFNGRLGVTGGVAEIVGRLGRRSLAFDWRGWFALGLAAGALSFLVLRGGPAFEGYGWLTETFHGSARIAIPLILLACGVLIGFGARSAGGCTSGNGLSATSALSPAGLAATATFFGTAIVVAVVIRAVV